MVHEFSRINIYNVFITRQPELEAQDERFFKHLPTFMKNLCPAIGCRIAYLDHPSYGKWECLVIA
jgi:hypothetical protein